MSTIEDAVDLEPPAGLSEEGEALPEVDYRALSSAAVASMALGLLSGLAILSWWLVGVPVVGILTAIFALRQLKQHSLEYTGVSLARTGLFLSLFFLVVGCTWQGYVYATEVPEWANRISFDDLQPAAGENTLPQSAQDLVGQGAFIVGYVLDDGQARGISRFVLVRDQGDCCFGGNPKETERVLVTLKDKTGFSYSTRRHKVAGKFRIQHVPAPPGIQGGSIYYHLDEAELR